MGVLDSGADAAEQLQPLPGRQAVAVAVLGDGEPLDVLHDEIGPPLRCGVGVEDPRHVGMVHQGQRLALGLEAGDDLVRVHADLDELQGDAAPGRGGTSWSAGMWERGTAI